jgi:uncharacterized protein YggE
MNQRILSSLCGLTLLCVALHAPGVLGDEAQQKSPEPTVTLSTSASTGIVSQVGPDSIAIQTTRSPKPVSYVANQETSYVDEAGNPVEAAAVTSGDAVTVYYSLSGTKMIAAKVVVKRSAVTQPRG